MQYIRRRIQRVSGVTVRDERVESRDYSVQSWREDWDDLWWCRLDGTARIEPEGPGLDRARDLLEAKYEQYRGRPPEGPAILIHVTDRTHWRA